MHKITLKVPKGDWGAQLTGGGLSVVEKVIAGEALSIDDRKEFMSCFMCDAKGKLLDPQVALETLRFTRRDVLYAEYNKLWEAISDKAVPPENGKPSEKVASLDGGTPSDDAKTGA